MSDLDVQNINSKTGNSAISIADDGSVSLSTSFSTVGIDDNATSTAITIDSSGDVSIGTSTAGVTGLSISATKNLGWTQSSGESLANMFRQQSSGALVIGCGYQHSSTANGFASSYSSSFSRAAASFSDSIRFYVDTASAVAAGTDITPTERMRIDSSGNVGIGTDSPVRVLDIATTTGGTIIHLTDDATGHTSTDGVDIQQEGTLFQILNREAGDIRFGTNGNERMRINSSGNLLISKTALGVGTPGIELRESGIGIFTVDADTPVYVNRESNDGDLIVFRQNNVTEGTISVSGTTVSYNGGHLSRWSQSDIDDVSTIYKGTVMSNLDEMCVWTNEDNEQLNKTKISDVEGDVNVAGVFVAKDNSDDLSDYYLAMTGDMIIRIAQGTTVQRGDLLISAGDGTAKPQDDDIVRSKTIAKVTSTNVTCTYADGSYCVPCVLMAC